MAKSLTDTVKALTGKPVKRLKRFQDEDARTEAFNEIKAGVDQLGAAVGDAPDWESIAKDSSYHLQKADRDLRVACYLARAWIVLEGVTGLSAGVDLLDALLRDHADELIPPRSRGRQFALEWWARHTLHHWQTELAPSTDRSARGDLAKRISALCEFLADSPEIAGQPKLLLELRDALSAEADETGGDAEAVAAGDGADTEMAATGGDAAADPTANQSGSPAEPADKDTSSTAANAAGETSDDAQDADDETLEDTRLLVEVYAADDPELARLIAKILKPISAEIPTGDEAYLSDEFESIQAQVNATHRVQEVDWPNVFNACRSFLSGLSKDLRVMAYTVLALAETQDVRGIRNGLAALQAFLNAFGANCHPTRAGGRRAALEWLSKSIDAWFRRRPDASFPVADIESCCALCDAINETLIADDKLLVNRASLGKAARSLRDQLEAARANAAAATPAPVKKEPDSKPTPAPTTTAAPDRGTAKAASAPAAEEIDSDAAFRSALSDGNSYIIKLVAYKRRVDAGNPFAYRLLRTWLWSTLGDQINTGALPAGAATTDWTALVAAEDPQKLLETAENLLPANRFALDLNRYSALALAALGHSEALAAVHDEVRQLLARFPALPGEQFAGGVPIADDDTRDWIQTQVLSGEPAFAQNSQNVAYTVDSEGDLARETLAEARAMAKSGDLRQAIELFERQLGEAESEKARFDWRLRLARFFMELGAHEPALAIVEAMESAIEEFRLERWDPAAAIEVARIAHQLADKIGSNSGMKPRAQSLADRGRARICRLQPSLAVDMPGQRK